MYHLIIVFRCIIQCPAILFHGQRQIVLHMCHDTDHIIAPGYVNLLIRSQQASHAFVQILQTLFLIPCIQMIKCCKITDPSMDSPIPLLRHKGQCLFQCLPCIGDAICHLLV